MGAQGRSFAGWEFTRARLSAAQSTMAAKEPEKGTSQYKQIDGVKYERNLLEFADEAMKSGGTISIAEAKELWNLAMDGNEVTPTERRTLEYILKEKKFTAPSAKYLKGELEKTGDTSTVVESVSKPDDEELPDFDEEENQDDAVKEEEKDGETKKGNYAAIHASGFRDFLLKPELLRATVDCGFEHPSEVQHACIPQAILGTDILCQAKSGMGKTAVFVLACLQQLDASEKAVKVMVICHTRELAYQIKHEFERFAKFFSAVKTAVVYGGMPIDKDKEMLKDDCPHVLIGTPGRVLALCRTKDLKLDKLSQFVLDECDKCLDKLDMRKDIQQIFMETPKKETGDDVQRHHDQGDSRTLQEIHAGSS